jgi:adenylate cyclase
LNLSELRAHIEGLIPPTLATLDARGVPNLIHISHATVLDDDVIGISRQFFKKTAANLDRDPRACMLVTSQETYESYTLQLLRLRVETSGPAFDAMSARVDSIAAVQGMSEIFKVVALDVFRVLSIDLIPGMTLP